MYSLSTVSVIKKTLIAILCKHNSTCSSLVIYCLLSSKQIMPINCWAIGFMVDSTAVLMPEGNMTHSEWKASSSVAVHGRDSTRH